MKPILGVIFLLIVFESSLNAQINTERFRKDADSIGFSGNADFEATIITGNTDFKLITLGGRLNYNWGNSYTFLVFDGGLGWNKGQSFFDQSLLHLRNVITIDDLIQHETFLQYDFNKKRKLLERELIGTGLRFRFLHIGDFKSRLGIAYMYEIEEYDLPDNSLHGKNKNSHRISTYLTFEIDLKKDFRFISVTYFQPEIGNWDDHKIISEEALIMNLGKLIDFNVKFNLRYDSRPPDETKELDTITKFGITVKF
ncbi:MAG: DUF481 domain-containing protein [bacterium]